MTAKEIIQETVAFYSEDISKRAVNEQGGYSYKTKEGNKCGVARCFNDYADFEFGNYIARYDEEYGLENHLQEQYKGHKIDFWENIQSLHDTTEYWDESGLTDRGKTYVEGLLKKYA